MDPAALFEAVFNSSPTGSYLLSPTSDAIILAVNDAFVDVSGRRREELVGTSLFAAFPGNADDPGGNNEPAVRASLARVLASGRRDTLAAIRYPIRVVLPSGELGFEERFWNAVSTPVFGADGRIACIAHSTTDVTGMVRAEAAMSESEKRFRALASATADVVYRMSPDWMELHQLEGRGFIPDTNDPRRLWIDAYIPPEDHELIHRAIGDAIRTRSVYELEHRVRRVDGSEGWEYSRAVQMFDERGEIYEWVGAASDITGRKLAEEKLLEADRRKDEFLAMLAHELRNPLAPIGAAAELLQMGRLDEARVRRSSEVIGRQIRHMSSLIDDLLDVSRVSRGQIELDMAPFDLRRIAANAVEQATPLVQSRGHSLVVELPPDSVMVRGDEKRLVQVVANILNNAAKYTPGGGHIALRIGVAGAEAEIEISDDGIGMEPALTARAFDLFTQARRSSDRASGGLGIGLALVRSLVGLHGGAVACRSAGVGQGSTFTVRLPLLPAQQRVQPPAAAVAPAGRGGLRIMVVDDNGDAAAMLAMLLEAWGHEVLVEHGPLAALARSRRAAPQVFLLDLGLPEIDGNELARRLRAQPETAGAVLVAVTGYGQESDRKYALAAGFDHHLVKPLDPAALAAILAGIAGSQGMPA